MERKEQLFRNCINARTRYFFFTERIVTAITRKPHSPPKPLHQINKVHNLFPAWFSPSVYAYVSYLFDYVQFMTNFYWHCSFPVPAAWSLQIITLHFIILREFHQLWNTSLRNLFLLPPITNKYPPLHPVDGKVSYCYRTPDQFRNESIISIGL